MLILILGLIEPDLLSAYVQSIRRYEKLVEVIAIKHISSLWKQRWC
jgi:hypothetical protein